VTASSLARHVDRRGGHRRTALRDRIATVLETLQGAGPGDVQACASPDESSTQLLRRLERALEPVTVEKMWLTLAVIGGILPTHAAVVSAARQARLDGPLVGIAPAVRAHRLGWPVERGPWRAVKVVTGRVLVDLHHTSQTDFATGIQRVARQVSQRWCRDHDVTLIGWTRYHTSLRELSASQAHRALHGNDRPQGARQTQSTEEKLSLPPTVGPGGLATLVVPWQCTYVLPELLAEPIRAHALHALLEFSGSTGALIGFDCVPLTSAETTAEGMSGGFSLMLAAIAHARRVAAISEGAANEYLGWRDMLVGTGLTGPDITSIALPVDAERPTDAALVEARELLITDGQPLVLVVGSHEPRKNHLAVLHAAQLLWREGQQFTLAFVGGNGWRSEQFVDDVERLTDQGYPVQLITALSDDLLWAAYRLARCVVFPSLNEGFGLPIAEALAAGTPVITSGFGSMKEIAAEGGALLVNPRDDTDLTSAMRILIGDNDVHARLSEQAANRSTRTWEQYAEQTWNYLVEPHPVTQPEYAPAIGAR
jgi:glycosyltransferase involved in cell wall biosynthesis